MGGVSIAFPLEAGRGLSGMLTPETEKAGEEGLLDENNIGNGGAWGWEEEETKAFLHWCKVGENQSWGEV